VNANQRKCGKLAAGERKQDDVSRFSSTDQLLDLKFGLLYSLVKHLYNPFFNIHPHAPNQNIRP
jgi:hypothetical protein